MIQTLLLLAFLIAGVVIAQTNLLPLHDAVSLRLPGLPDVALTNLRVLAGVGGALMVLWIAGLADLAMLRAQIARRNALLRAKDEEIMRVKSEAYDRERPILTDIRTQLEDVALQVNTATARLEAVTPVKPARVLREEIRTNGPDSSPRERVAVMD